MSKKILTPYNVKRLCSMYFVLMISVFLMACGNENISAPPGEESAEPGNEEPATVKPEETDIMESRQTEDSQAESGEENNMTMNIQIGDNVLTATLVQNSSTEALMEMLSGGPVTIEMDDYAGMEKVGPLPQNLPENDEQISTDAGDLILYQGNSFVIYYDTNSWNLTRLGKIDNMTGQELMDVLGDGSVTAVLSLPAE